MLEIIVYLCQLSVLFYFPKAIENQKSKLKLEEIKIKLSEVRYVFHSDRY